MLDSRIDRLCCGLRQLEDSTVDAWKDAIFLFESTAVPDELKVIEQIAANFRNLPDGDATLVHLAKREALPTIFTVDHSDFETYRIDGRRRFRIVPATRPC